MPLLTKLLFIYIKLLLINALIRLIKYIENIIKRIIIKNIKLNLLLFNKLN